MNTVNHCQAVSTAPHPPGHSKSSHLGPSHSAFGHRCKWKQDRGKKGSKLGVLTFFLLSEGSPGTTTTKKPGGGRGLTSRKQNRGRTKRKVQGWDEGGRSHREDGGKPGRAGEVSLEGSSGGLIHPLTVMRGSGGRGAVHFNKYFLSTQSQLLFWGQQGTPNPGCPLGTYHLLGQQ